MPEALERVKLRNDFYKDNFRRVVLVLLISLVMNVALMGTVLFMSLKPTQFVYFATTSDGRLVELSGKDAPVLDNAAVLAWASRHIPEVYQLDPLNYRSDLQRVQELFTPDGWSQFMSAYAKVINNVRDNSITMGASIYDVPVVLRAGVFGGSMSWQLQIPLLVSYQKDGKVDTKKIIMQVILQKADNNQSKELLGIAQVLEKDVTTDDDQS